MDEIKIKVDFEKKEIHGIECEHENKFEVAKSLNICFSFCLKGIIFREKVALPLGSC